MASCHGALPQRHAPRPLGTRLPSQQSRPSLQPPQFTPSGKQSLPQVAELSVGQVNWQLICWSMYCP